MTFNLKWYGKMEITLIYYSLFSEIIGNYVIYSLKGISRHWWQCNMKWTNLILPDAPCNSSSLQLQSCYADATGNIIILNQIHSRNGLILHCFVSSFKLMNGYWQFRSFQAEMLWTRIFLKTLFPKWNILKLKFCL